MAQYDGSIRIGTGIDEKGFKAGSKELESAARNLAKSVSDSFGEGAKIALQKQTDAFVKMNQQYAAQEQKVKDLAAKLHDMQRQKVETPIFKETSKELESTEKKLDNLYGTLRRLEHAGKIDTAPYQNAITQIDIYKEKISDLKRDLKDLENSGEAYVPVDTSKVQKELTAAEQKQMQLYSALQTSAESLTQKIGERVEKEEAVRKKIAEEAAEEERLEQIRENATVSDQKTVDLLERQKQLQEEISDLKKAGVTEGYQDYEDRIAELEKIKQELSGEAAEEERLEQIRVNATVSNQQIIDLLEQRKQLTAEIKDMEAAGVGLGYKQYEDANRELKEINGKIKDYQKNLESVPEKFEKMRKSANKAFNAVASGTKKSSGLFSTFASRFKGLALSLLLFNQISKAFNAIISGMKKGFENFMGYSDSYAQSVQNMKNAMSTLGNQFAAAFAPIVQMVIPWLTSLINTLTNAISHIAQFISILSGKSTFTKAKKVQDDYNKSLGGTAKAADKARGALAKFDDLDVLEKKDNTSGGGAGAENAGADMFEEVPVDTEVLSFWQRVQEAMKPVIEYARRLKDIFSQGFFDGLGDWEYRFESIRVSILSMKDSLSNIFADPSVVSSADSWAQSVSYSIGSIVGSMASIGLTIATNLLGGISTFLEENKDRIKGYLISMFDIQAEINQKFSELFDSIAYVFEAFASEQGQHLTANIIGIFADSFMGVTELAGRLAEDILGAIIQPFVDNKEEFRTALEGFLSVLSEITGTIKEGIDETFDKLNEVYDEHIKPFFDSIATGLSDTAGKFMEFWNNDVQPILDEWAQKFDEIWKAHIQPMLNKFMGLLGDVADFLKAVWENVLKPVIDWIIENILPVLLPIFDGIIKGVMVVAGGIADAVGGIIDVISGILQFLTGVFTGDWKKAWDGITKIFEGVGGTIKGIINGILGFVESFANGVVNAINTVIRALNQLSFDIPDWIPGIGGNKFGFNIPELSQVSIPRLATGAVIRGGNPFMAILGDQPAGQTNIEAPLETIRQAVREELSGITRGYPAGGQTKVVLNVNGTDVGEAILDDLFAVMSRRGYDVEVLGVT